MTASPDSVLLLEDDSDLAREIGAAFAAKHIPLTTVGSISALCAALAREDASVLILDRMIGDTDSLNLLADLRAGGDNVPVILISSLASVDDRIRGLKSGGDDYLVKPFAMEELIARVAALQRRAVPETRTRLIVGPLSIDLVARTVRRGERPVELLPREFALLEYLMRHSGEVVTRSMLLEDVWRYRLTTHTNVVDVHVGNLRRKIDGEGEERLIKSVRGIGFTLEVGGSSP